MSRRSEILRATGFAVILVVLMLVEWLRRVEFVNPSIRSLQAELLDVTLWRTARILAVIVLGAYFVVFFWLAVRNRNGAEERRPAGRAEFNVASTTFWKKLNLVDGCKIGLVLLSLVACLPAWGGSSETGSLVNLQLGIDQTTNVVVLLTGLALACAGELLLNSSKNSGRFFQTVIFATIPLFLAATGFVHPPTPHTYTYQYGIVRWTGLWVNPNVYGMLMGVGAILAAGQVVQGSTVKGQSRTAEVQNPRSNVQGLYVVLWFVAAVVCGVGLFKSYSRGAWIATVCGIICLGWQAVQSSRPARRGGFKVQSMWGQEAKVEGQGSSVFIRVHSWLRKNWRVMAVIGLSMAVTVFWQFRFTEWRPARRVFSVANINDFSWRNRVTAWDGAIRMMVDKPLFGYGWGNVQATYEKKYCPPNLENGLAIQMNDYFMLGVSAGVPALICFVVYVGLSLRSPKFIRLRQTPVRQEVQRSTSEISTLDPRPLPPQQTLDLGLWTLDWTKATCRAGAIVLLVGFWFDGGLFKLATGSVFWILLELGKTELRIDTNSHELTQMQRGLAAKECKDSTVRTHGMPVPLWLKCLAGALVSLSIIETIVLVGTPFLPVTKPTLAIARHWLIPPKAVVDLDFLVSQPPLQDAKLRVLLQHASLANYNRQLVNWSLDNESYRNYVLWPDIYNEDEGSKDAEGDLRLRLGDLNWRRTLWEYFYPPVRKENDPVAAAETVVKFLRQRITTVAQGPVTIVEMWEQQKADEKGFEALKVAAFRAVGIPARLNQDGQAELFADGKWQPGPR